MKIAVTGASGRVGRLVIRQLTAAGHTAVSIDRAPTSPADQEFIRLDMADYPALEQAVAGCDALIHLAAINAPGRHPDHVVHSNNVTASYNALRAAAAQGIRRVVQASSINAIGGRFSRWPRYDYLPVDESHPAYPEDPYSLSKLVCEQQASAIVRIHPEMSVASLRLHGVIPDRVTSAKWLQAPGQAVAKQLWGYLADEATGRAFLQAVVAEFVGHEVFYIVAPDTMVDTPSIDLKDEHYPEVPLRGFLSGNQGFFDCRKAEEMLGWSHRAD